MSQSKPFRVILEADQHRRLQQLSRARGASMGSLIRESVSSYLASTPAEEDSLAGIVGLFEDTGPKPYGDVSQAHDAYIADAVIAEWTRETRRRAPGPAKIRGRKRSR